MQAEVYAVRTELIIFNHIIKKKIVQYFCVVKALEMTSARKFTIPERGSDLIENAPCSNVTFSRWLGAMYKSRMG